MLLNAFIRRDHLVLRLLLVLALSGVGNTQTPSSTASSAAAVVTLSPSASPSTAQPGTILVNLTGSNFPSGTISPANVTVTLVPAVAGGGPTLLAAASAVTTIVGTTRRATFQVPPSPSLAPNVAAAGSTLTVKITAASANLVQGSTTANFGAGVSVGGAPSGTSGPVNVLSPTTATAQLAVDPATSAGARSVALQVSSQSVPLADRFVVTTSSTSSLVAPGISVATPMAYLASISGQTATGATFTSSNEAKLTIEPDASVVSVVPSSGAPGQTLTANITTQYTNFVQGATEASFGAGVSVGGAASGSLGRVTVTSPTTATAQLSIDPAASPGLRTVAVATGVQQATLNNGFSVAAPVSITLNPNSGQQGQPNLSVAITGQNTHFIQGTTQVSFGAGITVVSLTVNTPTTATAVININPAAILGPRDVTLTTNTEVATLSSGFTVTAGVVNQPPTITSQPQKNRTWVKQSPIGTAPQGRAFWYNTNVYDSVNDRMMIFSGEIASPPNTPFGWEAPPDVWVLANATGSNGPPAWLQLNPSPGPQGRFQHIVAYSQSTNRLIIQGGGNRSLGGFAFVDTWVLTNANGLGGTPGWIRLPDFPFFVTLQSAIYDDNSNRLMVFGGESSQSDSITNDVWILTDANGVGSPEWVHLSPTGTPPTPRTVASLAYDAASNRLIVFGGSNNFGVTDNNDVWVLTNANGLGGVPQWIQLNPSGTLPAPRAGAFLRYDPSTNSVMMHGDALGADQILRDDGIWVLSNANGLGGTPQWTQSVPTGEPPAIRGLSAASYQIASDRMVVMMGRVGPQSLIFANDVWLLTAPIANVFVGQTFSYQLTATDPNAGDLLTFSLDPAPPGMTIDPASGLVLWNTNISQVGIYSVTVRVT